VNSALTARSSVSAAVGVKLTWLVPRSLDWWRSRRGRKVHVGGNARSPVPQPHQPPCRHRSRCGDAGGVARPPRLSGMCTPAGTSVRSRGTPCPGSLRASASSRCRLAQITDGPPMTVHPMPEHRPGVDPGFRPGRPITTEFSITAEPRRSARDRRSTRIRRPGRSSSCRPARPVRAPCRRRDRHLLLAGFKIDRGALNPACLNGCWLAQTVVYHTVVTIDDVRELPQPSPQLRALCSICEGPRREDVYWPSPATRR